MEKIDKEIIKKSAKNLMFEVSDEEIDSYFAQIEFLLSLTKIMDEVTGVNEAEPQYFPYIEDRDYLKEDVAKESIKREDVLKNAVDDKYNQIKIPRVVKK